jgi:ribosome-associated protein
VAKPVRTTSPASSSKTSEARAAAGTAIKDALAKQALLPVLLDVSGHTSYTDFICILSARSDRHAATIASSVIDAMKQHGRMLYGQEGSAAGRWMLLDFSDIVFHVFYHPLRSLYDIEGLWIDAPRVKLKVPPEARVATPDLL